MAQEKQEQMDWHRLFGLAWADRLTGTSIVVEPEKDVSQKKQLLDVVLLKHTTEPLGFALPDGFEDLATHNLITFKSYQEALDGDAMNELVGHYTNYRKQVSPNMDAPLPHSEFRVFAVAVRYPLGLAQRTTLREIRAGVYEADHFTGSIRVIVIHQLPLEQQNAMFLLFSAKTDLLEYAQGQYRVCSEQTTSFLDRLITRYKQENIPMPVDFAKFVRETRQSILAETPVEELMEYIPIEKRLEGVPAEKRLEGIPTEKRLEGIPTEKRLEGIPTEKRLEGIPTEKRLEGIPTEKRLEGIPTEKRLEGLSLEQRLAGLSAEERRELLRHLQSDPPVDPS